jgi:hypothetical protein
VTTQTFPFLVIVTNEVFPTSTVQPSEFADRIVVPAKAESVGAVERTSATTSPKAKAVMRMARM